MCKKFWWISNYANNIASFCHCYGLLQIRNSYRFVLLPLFLWPLLSYFWYPRYWEWWPSVRCIFLDNQVFSTYITLPIIVPKWRVVNNAAHETPRCLIINVTIIARILYFIISFWIFKDDFNFMFSFLVVGIHSYMITYQWLLDPCIAEC